MKHLRTLIMSLFLLSPLLLSACGQCGGNSDCPTGQVCRIFSSGLPAVPGIGGGFFCEVESCTPATVRRDCGSGEVCINSACQCPENNPNCDA